MSSETRTPLEISRALDAIVARKSAESIPGMILLGMLAGIYIGFGAVAATTLGAYSGLPEGVSKLLSASVFCVGLILVIIPGSELFTGNILMATGLVSGKVRFARVTRNWIFVYFGNFCGALLLVAAVYFSGLMHEEASASATGENAIRIARAKIALPFTHAFIRGILCNMLVCLAVILAIAARSVSGKILGIYFPVMTFVLCGFEHSIANMYFLPAGLLAEGSFAADFFAMFRNLIPVTLGNIVGGLLVILLHPARTKQLTGVFARRERM